MNKDIPPNSVTVGTPCKVIGKFEDFVEKRLNKAGSADLQPPIRGVSVPMETAEWYWREFEERRDLSTQ